MALSGKNDAEILQNVILNFIFKDNDGWTSILISLNWTGAVTN